MVLIAPRPDRRTGWRARYKDPDHGAHVWESLDPALTTAEQRAAWCVAKSRALIERRVALANGAVRTTGTPLSKAIDRYFEGNPQLAKSTEDAYRATANLFLAWAKLNGLETCDELTRKLLFEFREASLRRPKRAPVAKGRRGARVASTELRTPRAVNSEFRRIGVALNYLRRAQLLPFLTGDDIADALRPVKELVEQPEFLSTGQCKQLLQAALRHDADTFKITRAEHDAGVRAHGRTTRYQPIAPFVGFMLLAGTRLSEGLGLRWDSVDLSTTDVLGKPKGEIRLKASDTKTRRGRTVSLGVTPGLRVLLDTLKLRAGDARFVFGAAEPLSDNAAKAALIRLVSTYGAPAGFTWQLARSTCATFQTNAPSLFGDAAAWASAKRLGHSVVVAEQRYAGLLEVRRDARTLEAAMDVEAEIAEIVARVGGEQIHRTRSKSALHVTKGTLARSATGEGSPITESL